MRHILDWNTKLTVKLTRDGRPYPHLTPHLWPLAWAAAVYGQPMSDRHHGEPNTLWPSDYCSPNCTCIIKRVLTRFEAQALLFLIAIECDKWPLSIKLYSDTRWMPGNPVTLKNVKWHQTEQDTQNVLVTLTIKYFYADIVVWFVVVAVAWFMQKFNPDN